MTKVTIDIRNIASSTHADDRVFFRAPVVREAPSGGLVNTANEVVTLTDGVGYVELTPGPVIVTFQCKGVADTSPKCGTVPDSGTVELSQVISGSFSYSPEVVTAAQAARDDAQDAAGQAKDYRDAAADSADEASTASSTAVSSASTAVTKADEAAASATTATTAASSASTSASQAATSRDQAAQSATDAAAALGTKADKVHTHTTAQVTGLDTALTGKADKVDVQNNLGDVVGLLAGWTADAIGGRNLIPGATTAPTERSLSATSYYWEMGAGAKLEAGVEYTFSVIVDKISDDDTTVGIELGLGNGRTYTSDLSGRISNIPYGERVTLTFIPPEDKIVEGRDHLAWRIRNSQKAVTVAYRELKLERGNRATPWTPAPEDTASAIKDSGMAEPLVNPLPPVDHSLALRLDTTVGTRVLAGDTMIYGDTGLRDITGDITNGWTASSATIRRVGNTVELRVVGLDSTSAAGNTLIHLPVGLGAGPGNTCTYMVSHSGQHDPIGRASVGDTTGTNNHIIRASVVTRFTSGSLSLTYLTNQPWPTSLPGTPA